MDWTLAVLVWIGSAVVAWWVATTKHAPDAGMWALWGLLLGPFGILAAIAWAKPGPVAAPGTAVTGLTSTDQAGMGMLCGRCGKPLSPVWRGKCSHCGASYAEYPPVARA